MLFTIIAIYKGYTFDDEYPGYGKLAKRKDNLKDLMLDMRDESLSELDFLHTQFSNSLNEKYDTVYKNVKKLSSCISAFNNQNQILKSYLQLLEGGYDFIIQLYRQTNSHERKDGVPDYFNKKIDHNLDIGVIEATYIDKREVLSSDKDELALLMPDIRASMLKIKDKFHNKINEISTL